MTTETTSEAFFEQKYRMDPDPWKFASSTYEQGRYAVIQRALNGRRYPRAFEPGCSIGMLTLGLASICGQVEAMDISPTAVALARERCKDLANVNIVCGELSLQIPYGTFDLIVLSEIGYYFGEEQLRMLAGALVRHLRSSGVLLASHWLGVSRDHVLKGERVHDLLGAVGNLKQQYTERHAGFRLDRWTHK